MAKHVDEQNNFMAERDAFMYLFPATGKRRLVTVSQPVSTISTHTETGSSVQNTTRTNVHN